ncbi:hypothetical protein LNN38_08170 [Pseudomonas sp. LA21]|uniref:hypothetical protein n=1 Tax=unclassified Pseudomonas TaxID=196821 RepID=UPI001A9D13A8|nr:MULTISPECIES: hypothetical protein [unclassified Pseudomonas]MCJ1884819.1 hypothetical protein [Pseudomonas sp. LA21]
MSRFNRGVHRQRGAVLAVALIMLLLVTLLAVAGFNLAQTNLKVVQNLESRELAENAASATLEEAISTSLFTKNPGNIFANSCVNANTKCYDVNGDGVNDITVVVDRPSCVIVLPIKNSELDVSKPADAGCFIQDREDSLCVNSVWELRATATDNLTSAVTVTRQGVAIRASSDDAETACPK